MLNGYTDFYLDLHYNLNIHNFYFYFLLFRKFIVNPVQII